MTQSIPNPAFSTQYQPPPPQSNQNSQIVTTVSAVTTALGPVLGPFPAPVKCPHCYNSIISQTIPVSGLATYLLVGGCCLLGLWLCCFIPFCINSCKDIHHYCPNCRAFLGRYRKLG